MNTQWGAESKLRYRHLIIRSSLLSEKEPYGIKIWDMATGRLLRSLQAGPVKSLTVDTNGRMLISGSTDYQLKVWDLRLGECCDTFSAEASIECVSLSAHGFLGAGDASGIVHLFKINRPFE
jgi:WD40 repeat protein